MSFADACDLLESALDGNTRDDILDAATSTRGFSAAVVRLRAGMIAHAFPTSGAPLALNRVVRALDTRTCAEGFHVLQAWDYKAHRFVDPIASVLLLDRMASAGMSGSDERNALATLLDHYFLSVLGLLAVRAWDEGDANANLDRVTALINLLNGPGGSGHPFVEDAELLLLVAVAGYHPEEHAYDLLLSKFAGLDDVHRGRVALACAPAFGSHLRWGYRFMYERDAVRMRDDNVVDYPWVLFSVETLLDGYRRSREGAPAAFERDVILEGLINVLSPDPRAFTGAVPECLRAHEASHVRVREWLAAYGPDLVRDLEPFRPDPKTYSPLGFAANFLNNAVVAMVETTAGVTEPTPSLNALFTRQSAGPAPPSPMSFARRLTRHAGVTAAHVGGHGLVVYDPYDGLTCFDATMQALRLE